MPLTHYTRQDCTRFGEQIHAEQAEQRDGEPFHRCPHCGAALSDRLQ